MTGILAQSAERNFVLPIRAASSAAEVDWLTWFIIWVCVVFGAIVFIGTIYLAWRYRHKPGVNDEGKGPQHSTPLEITWSVIPGIIVLLIAIWGFQGYMKLSVIPQEVPIEIQVDAYKWGWNFIYPNGYSEDQLHIPKGVPVRFVLSSRDVIHSFYIKQFRTKKDVVPGRFNKMWVMATETSPLGEGKSWTDPKSFKFDVDDPSTYHEGFDVYCAEYCGQKHSRMLTKVHVHPDMESYQQWLANASDPYKSIPNPVERGQVFAKQNGCLGCHSIDGKAGTGPTWQNLFGNQRTFIDGGSAVADENYIRDSILYPQKHVVSGYGPVMSSYLGKLSDRQIMDIITFQKSISEHYKGNKEELTKPTEPATQPTKDGAPAAGNTPATQPAEKK